MSMHPPATVRRSSLPPPDPPWPAPFMLEGGIPVLLEESHAIPIVDVNIIARTGALFDPPEREGLMRTAARMIRMGTRKISAEEVERGIDALGVGLSIEIGHGAMRIHATVIRRSLAPFLELLGSLLTSPALRASDLALLRRESIAEIRAQQDHDRWLASRAFRAHLFGAHPYGRPTVGSVATLRKLSRREVADAYAAHFVRSNLFVGIAGATTEEEVKPLLSKAFAQLPDGAPPEAPLPVPTMSKGRRVLVVDKPDRSQTQVLIGTLGTRLADPLFYPLMVANTAFGGTFTSRLTREIRSEKGWSYAVHSRLGADRQREIWSLYSHPSIENAGPCITRELELADQFVGEGIEPGELIAARSYLIKSHAFDRDTAAKRLEPRIEAELHQMPPEHYTLYTQHINDVTLPRANEAVRTRLSSDDLSIVVLATAKHVEGMLGALPKVRELAVVPVSKV